MQTEQQNTQAIDFSNVEVAKGSEYLEPGMYRLKVDADNVKVETPENKTPYLSVKLVSENGSSITEKFFLTAKALPRLQYLHKGWFGKELSRTFTNFIEVGNYFKAALTSKIVTRPVITGGKVTPDGKFYSSLPYTDFILPDGIKDFEEGPFEKDSERYKRVVRIEKANPLVANSNEALLSNTSEPKGYVPAANAGDMPW